MNLSYNYLYLGGFNNVALTNKNFAKYILKTLFSLFLKSRNTGISVFPRSLTCTGAPGKSQRTSANLEEGKAAVSTGLHVSRRRLQTKPQLSRDGVPRSRALYTHRSQIDKGVGLGYGGKN